MSADFSFDALLAESMQMYEAKKAAKAGKKLSEPQAKLLTDEATMQELLRWHNKMVFALFRNTTCACGASQIAFLGWYKHQTHHRGTSERLTLCEGHEGIPAMAYTIEAESDYCHECLHLPEATPEQCALLETLGQQMRLNEGQMELFPEELYFETYDDEGDENVQLESDSSDIDSPGDSADVDSGNDLGSLLDNGHGMQEARPALRLEA